MHPQSQSSKLAAGMMAPDTLKAGSQEAEPLIELFGDYLTRCVFSKAGWLRVWEGHFQFCYFSLMIIVEQPSVIIYKSIIY